MLHSPFQQLGQGPGPDPRQAAVEEAARIGKRPEIIAYIKSQLLPELAALYADAIESSVSTGCYDHTFGRGDYSRVDHYIAHLKKDWLDKQGDITPVIARIHYILQFGSDGEKAQLKKLLNLEQKGK